MRSDAAEAAILRAFLRRLEELGEKAADGFDDPFRCFEFLLRQKNVPTSFLESMCVWTRRNDRRNRNGRSKALAVAQLCSLDDACEARNIGGKPREQLDAAIRAFVVYSQQRN